MNPLLLVVIQNLPGIIAFAKAQFVDANPNAPEPSDAEVIAAYEKALASSLAKDSLWLKAHPE